MSDRYYSIRMLAEEALKNHDYEKAEALAQEYLEIARKRIRDWNYGNAIHHSNLILGRIALKTNKINLAKEFLLKASKTPGSPQLNSFGPNMLLASELLDLGERDVVIHYIHECKAFWKFYLRFNKPKKWKQQIGKGIKPDFKGHLFY